MPDGKLQVFSKPTAVQQQQPQPVQQPQVQQQQPGLDSQIPRLV